MRRGNRSRGSPRGQRGIAYLGVLMLVAALGLGMTQAARIWTTVQQREREAQLLFVGDQYRAAIASYYNAAGGSRYPASLEALLEDRRGLPTLRHLRRLYADPLTGSMQWGLVKAPDGGIMGVFSESPGRPLKRQGFPARYDAFGDSDAYGEWAFVYLPPVPVDGAANAPGGGAAH
ncbi:type II secretion system protein [Burkholderia stagnalis]|uniref:type II secretion system protein n=1 Tax=Burkholderia stagnalis TaxID=1503054 RepID=UPI00075E4899|nr:type II secretion system protein [Burkholderia stagnalis]KWH29799.1 type II secretory pathway, pseudopilin PulG [Burkholderia stagnalis]KWH42062.1 type II secretory pathway, pseudopilin PulG [Burkholderia stagnalis]RQQ14640.1 type II secretion system protein [Burkholderia stagnalis]RQQ17117.1 type II secretion system protein [Burkholderia stagnalis]RQQ28855.1 type II secretion system protein [Burkholderia stagnalis]